jgi:hypothetical protein
VSELGGPSCKPLPLHLPGVTFLGMRHKKHVQHSGAQDFRSRRKPNLESPGNLLKFLKVGNNSSWGDLESPSHSFQLPATGR